MTRFTLNGSETSVADDHPHLLAALREELGVTSPKDGCAPSGQCGCCTVLLDGKAVVSCQVPPTFAERRALRAGFCIPGIVLRAKSLIDKKGADLARGDAARHLGAHLCRCTG